MFEGESAVLSELVRERSLLTPTVREIEEEHERTGKSLSQVMIDFGLITEEQLLRAVAEHLNLEYLNLEDVDFEQAVLRSIPSSVARMYGAVPVSVNGNTVTVAVMDPYNPHSSASFRLSSAGTCKWPCRPRNRSRRRLNGILARTVSRSRMS